MPNYGWEVVSPAIWRVQQPGEGGQVVVRRGPRTGLRERLGWAVIYIDDGGGALFGFASFPPRLVCSVVFLIATTAEMKFSILSGILANALTVAGVVLWDGRFNEFASSTDLNNWSWGNQVGPYRMLIWPLYSASMRATERADPTQSTTSTARRP